MLRTWISLAIPVVAACMVGCLGGDDLADDPFADLRQSPTLEGINVHGERVNVDPSKVCWDTATRIPKGFVAVADPVRNSFRFVREAAPVGAFHDAYEYGGEGTGTVTCTCTSGTGGCSPSKFGDTVSCVMTTCTTCKKS
ncbi:hypothetical protein ACN47A_25305 [Myxococcus fulvus]|uniref:hypothetical protein n=1 Tax=Myxococcus fulvus TaxID=33 RepID=UPI003B9AA2B2